MTNIASKNNTGFSPKTASNMKTGNATSLDNVKLRKNTPLRKEALDEIARTDVKVDIPVSVKDFSLIRKVVDRFPEVDNRDKIARLKKEIEEGTYSVDYDAIAEKMLKSGF